MKYDLHEIKNSIESYSEKAKKEKLSVIESIEMFWLNADIQRKKNEVIIPDSAKDNVVRIRQLLAAAWSEDFK